ncbi:hypothetical protein [Corynebacterium durum]|uniref:hypothetical protein n=1 Tax=Corynebacterium durum TaxID=61592 RepID=UPI0036226155
MDAAALSILTGFDLDLTRQVNQTRYQIQVSLQPCSTNLGRGSAISQWLRIALNKLNLD